MKKYGVLIIAIMLSINQIIFAEETNDIDTTTTEVQIDEVIIPEETQEEEQQEEIEIIELEEETEPQEEIIAEETEIIEEETEIIEPEEEIDTEETLTEEQPMMFARPSKPKEDSGNDDTSSSVHHLDIRVNKVTVEVIDQNGNYVTTYEYASITNVHSAIVTLSDGTTTTIPGSLFISSSDGGTGDEEFDAEIENYKFTYDEIVSIEFIIDLEVSHDDTTYENYTKLSFIMNNNELIKAKELCYADNPDSFVHGYDFVFESPMTITVQETEDTEQPEPEPEPDPIVPEEVEINLVPATGDVTNYMNLYYVVLSLITLVKLNKKY